METNKTTILDDFNKAIKMGEDSYAMVIEKATDEEFKALLQKQSHCYEAFLDRVHEKYQELEKKPLDTPITQKIMGWTGIQMNTLTDSSNAHLSEMLIQGAAMGWIECYKLLNTYPDMDKDLHYLIKEFLELQEKVAEELKIYLRY